MGFEKLGLSASYGTNAQFAGFPQRQPLVSLRPLAARIQHIKAATTLVTVPRSLPICHSNKELTETVTHLVEEHIASAKEALDETTDKLKEVTEDFKGKLGQSSEPADPPAEKGIKFSLNLTGEADPPAASAQDPAPWLGKQSADLVKLALRFSRMRVPFLQPRNDNLLKWAAKRRLPFLQDQHNKLLRWAAQCSDVQLPFLGPRHDNLLKVAAVVTDFTPPFLRKKQMVAIDGTPAEEAVPNTKTYTTPLFLLYLAMGGVLAQVVSVHGQQLAEAGLAADVPGRLAIALVCVAWAAFVSAISLTESWVKFRSPFLTRHVAVDVGTHVFSALNSIEGALAVTLLVLQRGLSLLTQARASWHVPIGVALALALQVLIVSPLLNLRAQHLLCAEYEEAADLKCKTQARILKDIQQRLAERDPPPAWLHLAYVAADVAKLGALLAHAFLICRPLIPALP